MCLKSSCSLSVAGSDEGVTTVAMGDIGDKRVISGVAVVRGYEDQRVRSTPVSHKMASTS